jgi:hypothetical protein
VERAFQEATVTQRLRKDDVMISKVEDRPIQMDRDTTAAPRRIAFLVLAHSDAPLLLRLCERLRDHAVFVHVDAKSRDFPMEQLAAQKNVVLVQPRRAVHWADFSMVETTLDLLRTALDQDERFSKFVLISGACYPVKPIDRLAALFDTDDDLNYIRMTAISPSTPHLWNLVSRRWVMTPLLPDRLMAHPAVRGVEKTARAVLNKLSSYLPRDFQRETGYPIYFGSSWWAFSEPCARYIVDFVRDHPAFFRAFRTTYATDEVLYHTIVAQSPFAAKTLGAQADQGERTNQETPLHLIHPSEKRVFGSTETDFDLAQTTDKYFIRKISSRESSGLLDRIDRELL